MRKGLLPGVRGWESAPCFRIPSVYTALISPSSPLLFILFSASLSFLSSVWRPSFLFQPLSSSHRFLQLAPSFLSFFFPSFSALSLEFLFSLPPFLSSTRTSLLPPEAPSLPGEGGEGHAMSTQALDTDTPVYSCLGTTRSSCISCCFQCAGSSCVDCHVGMGMCKRSWEIVQRGPKAGDLGLCACKCPLKPKRKTLWEWAVHPQRASSFVTALKQLSVEMSKFPFPRQVFPLMSAASKKHSWDHWNSSHLWPTLEVRDSSSLLKRPV